MHYHRLNSAIQLKRQVFKSHRTFLTDTLSFMDMNASLPHRATGDKSNDPAGTIQLPSGII
jgi:hypothetical protein